MLRTKNKEAPKKQTLLTAEGHARLQAELKYLRTIRRAELANELHEVMDNIDWEDSEPQLILEQQAVVETRIRDLENILSQAIIIEPDLFTGVICIGDRVTVQQDNMQPEVFTIVGTLEANARRGLISDESPLGKALLGSQIGDEVLVNSPSGPEKFRILAVE